MLFVIQRFIEIFACAQELVLFQYFAQKARLLMGNLSFFLKNGSQGFWGTPSCPILRSYFAQRGPLVGGCVTHEISIGFLKLSCSIQREWATLGLCFRVFAPVPGQRPASMFGSSVPFQVPAPLPSLAFMSVSGSTLMFTLS